MLLSDVGAVLLSSLNGFEADENCTDDDDDKIGAVVDGAAATEEERGCGDGSINAGDDDDGSTGESDIIVMDTIGWARFDSYAVSLANSSMFQSRGDGSSPSITVGTSVLVSVFTSTSASAPVTAAVPLSAPTCMSAEGATGASCSVRTVFCFRSCSSSC